jgi:hypothetical protein
MRVQSMADKTLGHPALALKEVFSRLTLANLLTSVIALANRLVMVFQSLVRFRFVRRFRCLSFPFAATFLSR